MRPGGYTVAAEQASIEEEHIREEYEEAKQSVEQLQKEALRRRQEATKSKKRRSKRGLDIKDHDARFQRNRARISGKDGQAGRLASQMDGRVQQAESRLTQFDIKRKYDLSFWVPGSASKRSTLFSIPPGSIPLGGGRILSFPELTMAPDDRIAITGPNGSGKSTLIRHIMDLLTLPEDKVIYLPQEIDENTSREIMSEVITLPGKQLGVVMTVVSCLGSRPERLVRNTDVSPGEIRKVMLALGISKEPHLIIMDEPTNHLDLPAIELLEQALEGCPCGLLLVSHDYRFLSKLADIRWHISPADADENTLLCITGMEEPTGKGWKG
jgi:ATPase subunit of ABC transporter with duplicated ATPase domains